MKSQRRALPSTSEFGSQNLDPTKHVLAEVSSCNTGTQIHKSNLKSRYKEDTPSDNRKRCYSTHCSQSRTHVSKFKLKYLMTAKSLKNANSSKNSKCKSFCGCEQEQVLKWYPSRSVRSLWLDIHRWGSSTAISISIWSRMTPWKDLFVKSSATKWVRPNNLIEKYHTEPTSLDWFGAGPCSYWTLDKVK